MILPTLCLGLTALAQGQISVTDPNEATFQSALYQLSSQTTLFLQLTGSIAYKNKVTPLVTNVYWYSTLSGPTGTYLTLQVDMETWINGVLTKRAVSDGNTVWTYDLNAHQYSATSYGGTGTTRPANYVGSLLTNLNWFASSNDAYLVKLLKQIYNNEIVNPSNPTVTAGPPYTSWMPGVASLGLTPNLVYPDPVNSSVTYYPTPADNFYIYDGSPKRTIAFEIAQPTTSSTTTATGPTLATIYYNQLDYVAKLPRLTQWQIKPYTSFTFDPNLFLPYTGAQTQGWRPIVGPTPVTN